MNKQNAPMVSCIIPVRNAGKYLDNCLQSVTGQTLRDLEILCINDNSMDSSAEILCAWVRRDPRIRIISLEKNMGPGHARNLGIDAARGEFIRMVDADDFLPLDSTEKLLDAARIHTSDMVRGGFHRHRHDGRFLRKGGRFPKRPLINGSFAKNRELWFFDQHTTYLYRTGFIRKTGARYDERMMNGEDVAFLVHLAPSMTRVTLIPETVYCYRRNPSSAMQGKKDARYYRNLFSLYEMEYQFLTPLGYREQVDYFLMYHLAVILPKIVLPSLPVHLEETEALDILVILQSIFARHEIERLCFSCPYPWRTDYDIPLLTRQVVALLASGHIAEALETIKDHNLKQDSARKQRQKIKAIHASTSWKITAPLRFVAKYLR